MYDISRVQDHYAESINADIDGIQHPDECLRLADVVAGMASIGALCPADAEAARQRLISWLDARYGGGCQRW